jgi:hypothetical protein
MPIIMAREYSLIVLTKEDFTFLLPTLRIQFGFHKVMS